MARVYLGQSPTGRRLAIKIIRAGLAEDPDFRRRFAREVAAAKAVSPLFTAAVVDADTDAESPWLATTYIDGPSLDQLLADQGPLPPGAVLTLAAGLAEALASIHRSGLVHRDLKPSNVILNDEGPHIIDFGVALLSDATQATASLVLGTPSYMAPERLDGGEAGPAADIFSLGATLVRAATGKSLVNRGTVYEQMFQITLGRFDLSAVPAQLRPLVLRCISRRPKDRPTAEELLRILVAAGVSPPSPGWYKATATPTPSPAVAIEPFRTSRLSRRRALVFGGLFGAALAGGGIGVATGMFESGPGRSARIAATGSPAPGTVLWQARSGVRPPPGGPGSDKMCTQVIVDRGGIVTVDASQLLAADVRGRRRWTRTLSNDGLALRLWDGAVLATDTRRLWLLDPATGTQRFFIDVAGAEEAASRGDGPDKPAVRINAVVLSTERAFLNVGTALIAIDRTGRQVWRNPQPLPRDGHRPPAASPHVADARWLVTRNEIDSAVEIGLYDATTGDQRWSRRYDLPPSSSPTRGPGGPPPRGSGGPPPGPGGGGGPPGPGGGPPPDDDAWQRSQGRISESHVALRDAATLTVLRLSDGGTAWRETSPTPVAAIESTGEFLLVSAEHLTAYDVATGTEKWQAALRGAQIAISPDGRSIIVALENNIYAVDAAGGSRWQAKLPDSVQDAHPDRLTVADRVAFVTFKPRGPQQQQSDVDVVAIALDM
jgi:outer membrane protein assembly factor BamB